MKYLGKKRVRENSEGVLYVNYKGIHITEKNTIGLDTLPCVIYRHCSNVSVQQEGYCFRSYTCSTCQFYSEIYGVFSPSRRFLYLFQPDNGQSLTADEFNSIINLAFETHKKQMEVNYNAEWQHQ